MTPDCLHFLWFLCLYASVDGFNFTGNYGNIKWLKESNISVIRTLESQHLLLQSQVQVASSVETLSLISKPSIVSLFVNSLVSVCQDERRK